MVLLALAATVQAESFFSEPVFSSSTGPDPRWIEAADLNADGRLDLVIANIGSSPDYNGTVSILLGNGDGTFGTRNDVATGSQPRALGIADFNGDGRPDLVTANHESDTVSLLLGNGDGTFGVRTSYVTRGSPQWVAIADLNTDGHLDVVTANGGGGTSSVFLGNGDGTLRPAADPSFQCYCYSVEIADLDGDGRLDLVAATDCGKIQVLLGIGDGTFGPWNDVDTGSSARWLATADLDVDGRLDLVTSGDVTSVLLGNGDGTFGAKTEVDAANGGRVRIADLNGDGRLDLATCGGPVSVLVGNGDATFGAANIIGGLGEVMAFADFDADARLDVAAKSGTNTVSVLLNRSAPPPLVLSFELTPGVLNLASHGRWVTGYLEPPAPYAAGDIDIASIRLDGTVPVDPSAPTAIGDHDGNAVLDLTVRFDRVAVVQALSEGEGVPIEVTCTVAGQAFAGTDRIRVRRGRVAAPGAAEHGASLVLRATGTAGRLRVELGLGDGSPARLDLVDVAGRVLRTMQVGTRGPGTHRLDLGDDVALRSGIYFLRFTQGGSELRTRVAVVK